MAEAAATLPELVDAGVFAYKNRDFREAISQLQKALDQDPRHWRAKLYLAMSYYHGGEVFTAYRHFMFLRDNCTDGEIRIKAESALTAMNDQVQTKQIMPEMTCTMKKPILPPPAVQSEEASELEWVDERQTR